MARKIQLTQDQIIKVLDAMHHICVYVDSEEFLRVTCSLCDHNLFVGFEGENEYGNCVWENDLGADDLFIRAGEHCLPGPGGVSECDSMQMMGVDVDIIASENGLELEEY